MAFDDDYDANATELMETYGAYPFRGGSVAAECTYGLDFLLKFIILGELLLLYMHGRRKLNDDIY